jgi:hypothetical protein
MGEMKTETNIQNISGGTTACGRLYMFEKNG